MIIACHLCILGFPENRSFLEHRWHLSEQADRDAGTTEAARPYFDTVLPHAPRPLTTATEAALAGPSD